MPTEITLAGTVAIRGGDGAAGATELSGAQARAAFALLTLERAGGVSRDQLAEVVWPGGQPATWASALRTVVSRVRAFVSRALPEATDPLVAEGGRYLLRLPEDVAVDVEVAEAAAIAAQAALHQGDMTSARRLGDEAVARLRLSFLAGVEGAWVDGQRARLGALLVGALETTCQAAVALGDAAGALTAAEEAVARAPLRESAHRARMAALAAGGNRAEALRAYQALRRTLVDELGVDPSPETEAAYVDLLGSPSVAPMAPREADAVGTADDAGGTTTGVSAATRPVGTGAVGSRRQGVPFVGRERELAALAESWGQAVGGARHLVSVTGEAGVGKTRLVTEAARHVTADGGMVLLGRCDEAAVVPFQPLVEALDGYIAVAADDELPVLADDVRARLAGVLPSLAPTGRAPAGPARHGRARLFDAITALVIAAASERPLMLVLDDLQWADGDTLVILPHLLRRAGTAPLLVVAISRDHDPGTGNPLGEVIHSLDRDGWVRRLPLVGLAEPDVRTLVRLVRTSDRDREAARTTTTDRHDAALAHRLMGETAGNPFFLLELLCGGDRDTAIPPGVHDLVAVRVSRLGTDAATLLRTAAVTGLRFDVDIVASAAGLDPAPALDAHDESLASGLIIEESADRCRFGHDIVRRTIYSEMSGARRRATHRRVADAIETLRADRIAEHVGALAHHSAAAAAPGHDPRAVKWCRAAAAQAAEHGGHTEAARLYRRAIDHLAPDDAGTRAELLVAAGVALVHAGDPRGEARLVDAATAARRAGRHDAVRGAALALADLANDQTEVRDEALALIEMALSSDAPAETEDGVIAAGDGAWLGRARLMARKAELSGTVPAGVPVAGLVALRRRLDQSEGPDRVQERWALATELTHLGGSDAGDATSRMAAAHHRAMAAAVIGDVAGVDEALVDLASAASSLPRAEARIGVAAEGSGGREPPPLVDALLLERDAAAASRQGRWDDALAAAAAAAELYRADGSPVTSASVALRHTTVVSWLRATPTERLRGVTGGTTSVAADDAGLVLADLTRGDRGQALVRVRGALDATGRPPTDDGWLHDVGVLALATAELGDIDLVERVRALLAPYADLVCATGYRTFVGAVAYHLGRLAALCGDGADAERHLQTSLRTHASLGARPWVALSQHALADVLDARGRPFDREVMEGLRSESRWVATNLGMRPLSTVARRAARRGA